MTTRRVTIALVAQAILVAVALHGIEPRRTPIVYALLIAAACVPWVWLTRAALRGGLRGGLAIVLTAGVILRVIAVTAPAAVLSDDIYRYAWEGRVQSEGHNPFLDSPASLEEIGRGDPVWEKMNNREIPAAYPPIGQLFLRAVASVTRSVSGFRLAFGFVDIALMFLIAVWLTRIGKPPVLACVHALCPLAVVEFCAEGHNDALAILLLIASFAWFGSGRASAGAALMAGAFLGLSIGAKFLPVVLIPWFVRRDWRTLAPCVAVFALSYVPFWPGFDQAADLFRGLREYGARWRSNDSLFVPLITATEWLLENTNLFPEGAEAQRVSKIPLAAIFGIGCLWIFRKQRDAAGAFVSVLTLLFAITPTLHPWYVLWVVPFLAVRPSPAPFVLIATVSFSYHVLPGWFYPEAGAKRVWRESLVWKLVEYVPFYAVLGIAWWRARGVCDAASVARKTLSNSRMTGSGPKRVE